VDDLTLASGTGRLDQFIVHQLGGCGSFPADSRIPIHDEQPVRIGLQQKLEGYRLTMAAGLELRHRPFDTADSVTAAEPGALAKGGRLATGAENQQASALSGCERTQRVHRCLELRAQLSRPLLLAEALAQPQGIAFHAAQ